MLPLFTPQSALIAVGLAILYLISRRIRRSSIAHLPGPKSHSWFVGNIPDLQRPEDAGEADFEWSKTYGLAFRTKGCFGENHLHLIDTKAIQHVLNRGCDYPTSHEDKVLRELGVGRGIAWAEGEQHARHRKIMIPAFSYSVLKDLLPLFFETAQKTTSMWKAKLDELDQQSSVIDVSSWLTRTTFDIIGASAFGYYFNSVEGKETELSKVYNSLFTDVGYMISDLTIMFRRLTGFAPLWLVKYIASLPKQDLRSLRHCKHLTRDIGKQLLAQQHKLYEKGEQGGKDVMSILVKANLSESPESRLSKEEVLPQIMTLLLAGHETSGNTLTWVLYELSKHRDVQNRVRDEIRMTREKLIGRRDNQITVVDLESMKYMVAVIKETLRLHPIVHYLYRRAGHNDVIPLEQPQRTITGEMVTEVPVSRGQNITVSLCGYNRLKSVWGEDVDQWRPERFLDKLDHNPPHNINLGTFGNLATFGAGLHYCLGWRFAILEMQAILIEMIESFEFSPPPGDVQIKRAIAALLKPMVKGQESRGVQMPLVVTAINQI